MPLNLLLLALILIFSFLLIKSADLVVTSLKHISQQTKAGVFLLSSLLLAVGTSLPELTVSFTSALNNSSNLVLGVVIGSNIANIALVAGIATVVRGKVKVNKNYYQRDVLIAFIASLAPLILIIDGELTRIDGLILLAMYGSYATSFFNKRYREVARGAQGDKFFYKVFSFVDNFNLKTTRKYSRLFVGVALLLLSADIIVRTSKLFAENMGIPVFLVGLFILAIGTSLPELAFSLRSLKDKHPSMFFGNLLGSTIANSTLIVGVAATISPIELFAVSQYVTAAVVFIVVFILFWYFMRSKGSLARWEAAVLIIIYLVFTIIEILWK